MRKLLALPENGPEAQLTCTKVAETWPTPFFSSGAKKGMRQVRTLTALVIWGHPSRTDVALHLLFQVLLCEESFDIEGHKNCQSTSSSIGRKEPPPSQQARTNVIGGEDCGTHFHCSHPEAAPFGGCSFRPLCHLIHIFHELKMLVRVCQNHSGTTSLHCHHQAHGLGCHVFNDFLSSGTFLSGSRVPLEEERGSQQGKEGNKQTGHSLILVPAVIQPTDNLGLRLFLCWCGRSH